MGHDKESRNNAQVKTPSRRLSESEAFVFPPSSGMFGGSGEIDCVAPGQTGDRGLVEEIARRMKESDEAVFPPSEGKAGVTSGE